MTMTFQELLLLRLEIDALNAEFAYLIDHDQSDRVAELFTEDGVYGRSTGQRSAGRDAIRQSYQRRKDHGVRTARHIFSNLRLTPIADGARLTVPLDSAATVSDLLVRLRTADVEVRELSLSKPTLDEVFLALTGHGAADAEDRDAGEHASQKVNA